MIDMKSFRSGTKWAHVSCAIWIPEVTIGCVEKMEPITKISMIPVSPLFFFSKKIHFFLLDFSFNCPCSLIITSIK